jgi:hypothetical protein
MSWKPTKYQDFTVIFENVIFWTFFGKSVFIGVEIIPHTREAITGKIGRKLVKIDKRIMKFS